MESTRSERVILVDGQDREIGTEEKMAAHRSGEMHRAFSIFVFNSRGELLLQQRAFGKYHSGGLWSNTCCGHPRPYEEVGAAAHRRLGEEMGFDCPLIERSSLTYHVALDHGLIENEYLHVFAATWSGEAAPNPAEAAAVRWVPWDEVVADVAAHPERYTAWFSIILRQHGAELCPTAAS